MMKFTLFACSASALKIHAPEQITVTMIDGEILDINIDQIETVGALKNAICDQKRDLCGFIAEEGVLVRHHKFLLNNQDSFLENDELTLTECNIDNGTNLDLVVCESPELTEERERVQQHVDAMKKCLEAKIDEASAVVARQQEHEKNGIHSLYIFLKNKKFFYKNLSVIIRNIYLNFSILYQVPGMNFRAQAAGARTAMVQLASHTINVAIIVNMRNNPWLT